MSDINFQALLPDGWERARGFSHGVTASGGRRVAIAGMTGAQPGSPGGGSFSDQWARALAKVVEVMRTAGGTAAHITAMRIYVTSLAAYREAGAGLGDGWRAAMGKHFPAMTLVEVTGLVDADALVEIEAEGLLP